MFRTNALECRALGLQKICSFFAKKTHALCKCSMIKWGAASAALQIKDSKLPHGCFDLPNFVEVRLRHCENFPAHIPSLYKSGVFSTSLHTHDRCKNLCLPALLSTSFLKIPRPASSISSLYFQGSNTKNRTISFTVQIRPTSLTV